MMFEHNVMSKTLHNWNSNIPNLKKKTKRNDRLINVSTSLFVYVFQGKIQNEIHFKQY